MDGWLERFNAKTSGLTLLRGEPGTGKTTFIRYLMQRTTTTHRFYFVPLSVGVKMSHPEMIEFWLEERKDSRGLRDVAIFEDAEHLLEPRHDDNQGLVSEMLNAADGLLGDCLHLQIIATVNCPLEKLDKAVTRPGRLIGYREFRRLNTDEAAALAARKGLQLPMKESFSLAEIYNQAAAQDMTANTKRIGFTVNPPS
jgi:ATP-dependent 26S proteasome regulatory subunit